MPEKPPKISSSTGIVRVPGTAHNMRRVKPFNQDDAVARGLMPEGGFDWSQPKISENGEEEISENSVIAAVRNFRKFTPDRVEKFLTHLSEHGVLKLACLQAGLSPTTIINYRKENPEFNEQVLIAIDTYDALVEAQITAQALSGMEDIKYDRDGNVISRRVTYEQQIRLAMLKKANKDYVSVEKQQVGVVGGIVAIPAPQESTESWDDIVRKYVGDGQGSAGNQ